MELGEMILEIIASMREVLLPFIIVVIISVITLLILGPMCRRLWVNKKSFRWLGVFYGLSGAQIIQLAAAWVKLLLLIVYLVLFEELGAVQYLVFIISGLAYALDVRHPKKIPGRLFWLVIETIGLVTASIVCGYIHDMRPGMIFTLIYIAIAVFLGFFGIYLFIIELDDISSAREKAVKDWITDKKLL